MTEQLQRVTAHLVVRGAIDAIEFYKKAFGATENLRMPTEDGKRLMHADVTINGMRIFLVDDFSDLRIK